MQRLRRSSQTPEGQLTLGLCALIVLLMGTYGAVLIVDQQQGLQEDAERHGLELARGLSLIGATAVLDNLFVVQEALMSRAGRDPDILSVLIVDRDRMVIASDNPMQIGDVLSDGALLQVEAGGREFVLEQKDAQGHAKLAVFEPLRADGKLLGWVRVDLSLERAWREAYRTLWKQLGATVCLLAGALYVFLKMVRRLKVSLRASEDKYRHLVDNAHDIIYRADANGRFTYYNPTVKHVLGYDAQELLGRHYLDLVRPNFRRATERFFGRQFIRKIASSYYEFPAVAKDGAEVWIGQNVQVVMEGGRIAGFQAVARDITARRRAEVALAEREQFLRTIIEAEPECVKRMAPDGTLLDMNAAGLAMIEADSLDEVRGKSVYPLVRPAYREAFEDLNRRVSLGESDALEFEIVGLKGTCRWMETHCVPLRNEQDGSVSVLSITRDITKRKQAEAALRQSEDQLRQSQKMEAIGKLAGGIAHDFNNLLTAITGYSDLLLGQVSLDGQARKNGEEIRKAAFRAAALTNQLLAFSRRQMLTTKVLNLNAVVMDLEPMLRRLIGEDVAMKIVPGPALGQVQADPSQIEQIVLNLVVNARDAMTRGGVMTIETSNVSVDESSAGRHETFRPGPYVLVAVSDTGCGMDEPTRSRIFEPFFTTKEPGKGTGLGLSTVYGIVKQSDGYVWVYSEPGLGTTFKVYLPRITSALNKVPADAERPLPPRGTETILLVEDEDVVRSLVSKILQDNGYRVLAASRSEEAFLISGRHEDPIHLLVADVVMPGMSGRELAERLVSLRPLMKVLYISGYTDDAVVRHGVQAASMAFLQKPFTPAALLHKVREVLETRARDGAAQKSS